MATAKSTPLVPGAEGMLGKLTSRMDELRKQIDAETNPIRRANLAHEFNGLIVKKDRLQKDQPATATATASVQTSTDSTATGNTPPAVRQLRELVQHARAARAELADIERQMAAIEAQVDKGKVANAASLADQYQVLAARRNKLLLGGPPSPTTLAIAKSQNVYSIMGVPAHSAADPAELKAVDEEIAGLEKNGVHSGTTGPGDTRMRDRYNELLAKRSRLRGAVPPARELAGTIADSQTPGTREHAVLHHRPAGGDKKVPNAR